MPFYADLHLHSKYARATSGDSDLEHLALWAAKKGVTVLGTGDFTHPTWLAEIKDKLVTAEPGLFRLRPDLEHWASQQCAAFARQPTRFLLEVEISTIYKKGERTRKVHHLHYVPDLAAADRFVARLSRIGNLKADGRPILGLDSRDLLEITLEAGEGAYLIPAHIWTPWFAVLGSKSGFDTIQDCYGDLTRHIFALETGLSSDPPMNWRLSQLDRYRLVSNSDAHSPPKIGREACVFDCALDYWAIRHALETGHGYGGTVEFFPEEGKYHLDGHRTCGVRWEPEETKRQGGICPTCGKEITIGVMHRVDELADRHEGAKPEAPAKFRSLVPLPEMLAEIHRVGAGSQKVANAYESLVHKLGSELFILEQAPLEDVGKAGSALLAEGIARMRGGKVIREAGYDGEYGVIRVFTDDELAQGNSVSLLFEMPAKRPKKAADVAPAPETGGADLQVSPTTLSGAMHAKSPEGSSREPPRLAGGEPVRMEQGALHEPDRPLSPSLSPGGGEGARRAGEGVAASANKSSWITNDFSAPLLPLACDPLAGLDSDQRAAAQITKGPLLIIAGPGTGKTRTLTHRIAHLVVHEGAAPDQILAVTFTNRAAREMGERLEKLIPSAAPAVWVTTFHGLGYRLLREHGARVGLPESFRIASEAELQSLLAEKLKLTSHQAGQMLGRLSRWKREGRSPDAESEAVVQQYQRALRERGWVDFDDLISLTVELLESHSDVLGQCRERLRWISVDEFQDIDERQYRLVTRLVSPDGNLCVIGDPDQAIYSFRGAEPRYFQQFAADYPAARAVQLGRNYRSVRAIVQGALQAIAPATLLAGRQLESSSSDATKIKIHESPTDKAEAEFVVHTMEKLIGGSGFFSLDSGRVESGARASNYSFSDFAVLYRTDAQADLICEALGRSGIPFQRHTHAPLAERESTRRLLEAARALSDELTVLERLKNALGRLKSEIRNPKEGRRSKSESESEAEAGDLEFGYLSDFVQWTSDRAIRCGRDFARFESELALLSEADLWDPRADRVSLLTLHASKGLEFAVVFIVGCEDGLLPLRFGASEDTDADVAEERRLFFVGMTRARERLFLTHAKRRLWRRQLRQRTLSPFVAVIQQEWLERSRAPAFKRREEPAGEQLDLFAQMR